MDISIRRFVAQDGERTSVMVDAAGVPLYYPNLFVTWKLRANSWAANSIFNALTALKAFYAWQEASDVDVESQFSRSGLLDDNQIRDLSDYLQRALPSRNKNKKVVRIGRRAKIVSPSTHYFRLTIVANYLGFLSAKISPTDRDGTHAKKMVERLKANRPSKPNRSASDRDEVHLDEGVIDYVANALKPGSSLNPAKEYAIQLRNMLMFVILRVTGMRRGELLNLKTTDLDFSDNTLRIMRRPDSTEDPRAHQPTAKTLQRTIPLSPELMNEIYEYITRFRNKLPGAKKHGYLFVTHKLGPTQGRALSIPAFQKWIGNVASIAEGSGIRAHALRHHWNYSFSLTMDNKGVESA